MLAAFPLPRLPAGRIGSVPEGGHPRKDDSWSVCVHKFSWGRKLLTNSFHQVQHQPAGRSQREPAGRRSSAHQHPAQGSGHRAEHVPVQELGHWGTPRWLPDPEEVLLWHSDHGQAGLVQYRRERMSLLRVCPPAALRLGPIYPHWGGGTGWRHDHRIDKECGGATRRPLISFWVEVNPLRRGFYFLICLCEEKYKLSNKVFLTDYTTMIVSLIF